MSVPDPNLPSGIPDPNLPSGIPDPNHPDLPSGMQIFISIWDGRLTLNVNYSDTIASVKQKIQESKNIPAEQQELSFAGNVLQDGQTIAQSNILKESTIDLLVIDDDDDIDEEDLEPGDQEAQVDQVDQALDQTDPLKQVQV